MDSKRPCEPFPEDVGNFFFAWELGSGLRAAPQHWVSLPGRDHFSSWDKDQLDTLASQWRAGGTTQPRYRKWWEAFLPPAVSSPPEVQRRSGTSDAALLSCQLPRPPLLPTTDVLRCLNQIPSPAFPPLLSWLLTPDKRKRDGFSLLSSSLHLHSKMQ